MFSSKSKNNEPAAPAASSAPAGMQSGSAKRGATRPAAAPSLISADLVVNGTLTSSGDIQVDGRVEGDVNSAGLVIGEKAFINGEVMADDVTVRGRVQGSIRARKVLLAATSHVEGNILHEAFAVEAGAFFEGNCRHSDNPLSDEHRRGGNGYEQKPVAVAPKPAEPPRPAQTNGAAGPAATVAPLKTGA